ncbi:MAG: NAD-dependent epimerase/dehydratase family protein, partial [Puniceicoccaceae bacterium]
KPDGWGVGDAVPEERRSRADRHEPEWHGHVRGHGEVASNLVSAAGGGIEGYRLSYLEGNRSIRDWALQADVGRFIYSSATSVYPQTDGEWVDEEDVPELDRLSENGRILRQAELEILDNEVFPRRYIARLGGIYGPGRHLYLNRLREGATSLPGDGLAWLNLIYLHDIVDALMRLAEAGLPGCADIFNVVDNEPARKQAIVDWLAETLALPSIPFDPNQSGPRALRRAAGKGLPNRRISNGKLREVLGWNPRFPDFRAGYRDILNGA